MSQKRTEFDKLQKEWYAKLAKTGFVDVEAKEINLRTYRYGGDGRSEKKYTQFESTWRDSKVAYYNMATSFLNEHEFMSDLDKAIWEYHTNGLSTRKIGSILTGLGLKRKDRFYAWSVVKRLQQEMKAKYLVK